MQEEEGFTVLWKNLLRRAADRGMTQIDVARSLGIGQGSVSSAQTGRTKLGYETVAAAAKLVELDELEEQTLLMSWLRDRLVSASRDRTVISVLAHAIDELPPERARGVWLDALRAYEAANG